MWSLRPSSPAAEGSSRARRGALRARRRPARGPARRPRRGVRGPSDPGQSDAPLRAARHVGPHPVVGPLVLLVSPRPFEDLGREGRVRILERMERSGQARQGAPRTLSSAYKSFLSFILLRGPRRAAGHGLSGRRREEAMAEAGALNVLRGRAQRSPLELKADVSRRRLGRRQGTAKVARELALAGRQSDRPRRGRLGQSRRVRSPDPGSDDAALLARSRPVRRRGAGQGDALHQRVSRAAAWAARAFSREACAFASPTRCSITGRATSA